jgi:hypothetical protein
MAKSNECAEMISRLEPWCRQDREAEGGCPRTAARAPYNSCRQLFRVSRENHPARSNGISILGFGIGNNGSRSQSEAQCRGPHLAIEARAPDRPRP